MLPTTSCFCLETALLFVYPTISTPSSRDGGKRGLTMDRKGSAEEKRKPATIFSASEGVIYDSNSYVQVQSLKCLRVWWSCSSIFLCPWMIMKKVKEMQRRGRWRKMMMLEQKIFIKVFSSHLLHTMELLTVQRCSQVRMDRWMEQIVYS